MFLLAALWDDKSAVQDNIVHLFVARRTVQMPESLCDCYFSSMLVNAGVWRAGPAGHKDRAWFSARQRRRACGGRGARHILRPADLIRTDMLRQSRLIWYSLAFDLVAASAQRMLYPCCVLKSLGCGIMQPEPQVFVWARLRGAAVGVGALYLYSLCSLNAL